GLAAQRPAFGWGWVSYWVPWVEPFTDLAVRKGVTYLQAHNAWLDVWLQLGIAGLVVFIALVVGASYRAWWFAVDLPRDALGAPRAQVLLTLAPALLLTALIAQSFFESRLLIEGGWALLVVIAVKTKLDLGAVDLDLGDRPVGLTAAAAAPTDRVVRARR
ncbi:MAG: O-antigen ligase family protein, partial [Herbiconiux sp.]|nr:O-antigen ligase family protein [Herbiconiux sp.]